MCKPCLINGVIVPQQKRFKLKCMVRHRWFLPSVLIWKEPCRAALRSGLLYFYWYTEMGGGDFLGVLSISLFYLYMFFIFINTQHCSKCFSSMHGAIHHRLEPPSHVHLQNFITPNETMLLDKEKEQRHADGGKQFSNILILINSSQSQKSFYCLLHGWLTSNWWYFGLFLWSFVRLQRDTHTWSEAANSVFKNIFEDVFIIWIKHFLRWKFNVRNSKAYTAASRAGASR